MRERSVNKMKRICLILLAMCLAGCQTGGNNQSEEIPPVNEQPPVQENQDVVVHFSGVGDNLIHQTIYEDADRLAGEMNDGLYDFLPMYADVKDLIDQSDLAFINQETILGGDDSGLSGYPSFNSPQVLAQQLPTFGFNLINQATNHSLDRSQSGVLNCISYWKEQSDALMNGVYESQEDRDTIRVIEKNGIRFAFLAYTYGTNGIEPYADYAISYFDEELIRQDVAKAKEISDVILASAHWGNENEFYPSAYQQDYAQLFADLGVDVVIGTHPHVIQPVEWVTGSEGNNTLVVYSLGNFIGGMLDMYNNLSGMIQFDFIQNQETKKITIENVLWTPLISHYEGDENNILEVRSHYRVIQLKNYSDELASQHGLNGVDGQVITRQGFIDKTNEVIGSIEIDQ